MKKARYICFEGTEGVGKTTQTQKLVDFLRARGYKVLQTKEPGTNHAPLTMTLRGIMLDSQYENQITPVAREFISQAIRSIHLERVISPAMSEYDFIIQDRGVLSGYAYGAACGNNISDLMNLSELVRRGSPLYTVNSHPSLYDDIIYLRGDPTAGLAKALTSKQEFEAGDAMEARGSVFMDEVQENMDRYSELFNTRRVDVDGKSITEVFSSILEVLEIKE